MSKTLYLPDHVAQKMNKEKVDSSSASSEVGSAYVDTQDEELNQENKDIAIAEYSYGPATTDEECGDCGMYNQTEDMLACIEDDSGDLGYCQLLKFSCMSESTCNEWVEGGPITSDLQEEYRDNL